jgi:hypothetical protein
VTKPGDVPTAGANAGGLSYFSSGSLGSSLGFSVWLEAAAISRKKMREPNKPDRSIPADYKRDSA